MPDVILSDDFSLVVQIVFENNLYSNDSEIVLRLLSFQIVFLV